MPTVLTGVMNIYPDKGLEEFRSGVSVLRYALRGGAYSGPDAGVDSTGSGTFTALAGIAWTDSIKGFLWWESRSGSAFPPNTNGFAIDTVDAWTMHLMLADPLADPVNLVVGTAVPVDVTIKMFFSGPVDEAHTAMYFEGQGASSGLPQVPAVLTVNGGIVVATPQTPLELGANYRLKTADGVVHSVWDGPTDPFGLDLTTTP
jgi:hypothetical protein